ncbi:MAG: T9SS type A sorting domain-containing protein, partial [Bacteroidota bacterium]
TTVHYSLPSPRSNQAKGRVGEGSHVTLKVYDVLGREVATLVNEEKPPGTYSVSWDASNLASGVYFYRLNSGSYSATKKMILIR